MIRMLLLSALTVFAVSCSDDPDLPEDSGSGADAQVDAPDTSDDSADMGLDTQDAAIDTAADSQNDVPDDSDRPDSIFDDDFSWQNPYPDTGTNDSEHCANGVDDDGDEDVDCDDSDCGERLICTQSSPTNEAEPNSDRDDVTELSLPFDARGTIGPYTVDDDDDKIHDWDWWVFTVDSPTLIDWRADDANGPAILRLRLYGLDDNNDDVVRRLDFDTLNDRRQAYLPFSGRYGVQVMDDRNANVDDTEVPYGDDDFDYAFSIESVSINAQVQALPLAIDADLGANNEVAIYQFDTTAGAIIEAELTAQRLSPSTQLDAILLLVDRTADGMPVLDWNDDAPIGTTDPYIRTNIFAEDEALWLIVDAYQMGLNSDYLLRAEVVSPSEDREPNNSVSLASAAVVDDVITGDVIAPFLRYRSTITDRDYYFFPGGNSTTYLIDLTATGANLDASLRAGYFGYSNGIPILIDRYIGDPTTTRNARLETTSMVDGFWFVEVADRRNLFDNASAPVGGEGFDYELTVSTFARTINDITLPYTGSGELTELGEDDWYEFTVPANTRLNLSADEVPSESFQAYLYLTEEDDDLNWRATRALSWLVNVESVFRVAITDRRGGGGTDFDYNLDFATQTFSVVAEREPNDSASAQGLEDEDVWVEAVLTGENRDNFDSDVFIVNLEVGDTLRVETVAGPDLESDDADTTLSITGPGLAEPVVDRDSSVGWFSRLIFEPPETGAYFIEVTPDCTSTQCSGGDYGLTIGHE